MYSSVRHMTASVVQPLTVWEPVIRAVVKRRVVLHGTGHSLANDVIKRALTAADVPCRLERDEGKPWTEGRYLVWDLTCPVTFATSHLNRAVTGAEAVASEAQAKKKL